VDIPRDPPKKHKKFIVPGIGVLAIALVTVGVSRLEKRAPGVELAALWIDTVEQGELLREVSGNGTLVPEDIRWLTAISSGRVEQVFHRPGARVGRDTVLMVLSNPDLLQNQLDAERTLSVEENAMVNLRTNLESQRLSQEGAVAQLQSAYADAKRQFDTNEQLWNAGKLVAETDYLRSKENLQDVQTRLDIARKQLDLFNQSLPGQIAAQQTQIDRAKDLAEFARGRVDSLRVAAGAEGVLTELPFEVGQWAQSGQTIAKIVQPGRLKAVLRVQETQMRDVVIGQSVTVDTRNGLVKGVIQRIEPASQGGTVGVEVRLEGELPPGARPDLNVDGRIEIERLPNVLYVGRPAFGQAESTVELFKLTPDGDEAVRVKVGLGKSSVQLVEIRSGLSAGDVVILSDMAEHDGFEKVRIVR
jgi:multidrug resistance efflux pump